MKTPTIFVTYNPSNQFEQTIAARLQTIGAVSNFVMYMPDRFHSEKEIGRETEYRIKQADYVIIFSLSKLSPIVLQELKTAYLHIKDKAKIIVIYDKVKGKNISGGATNNFTEYYFDINKDTIDEKLKEILNNIKHKEHTKNINSAKQGKSDTSAVSALLGIGLGLLVLGALTSKK